MRKEENRTEEPERKITMGSLFDGIGGFPLAAVRNGIEPVWAGEIEAFPIKVTRLWFPQMQQVGDIGRMEADHEDDPRYRFIAIPVWGEKAVSNFEYDHTTDIRPKKSGTSRPPSTARILSAFLCSTVSRRKTWPYLLMGSTTTMAYCRTESRTISAS